MAKLLLCLGLSAQLVQGYKPGWQRFTSAWKTEAMHPPTEHRSQGIIQCTHIP